MSPIVEPPPYGTRANPDGSVTAFSTLKFEPTTTPLDPSLVKVGDTVTLEDRRSNVHDDSITVDPDWRLTGKVRKIHVTHSDSDGTPYAWSVRIGDTPYWMGTAEWTYTLTAHQPAPAPEWKPGTLWADEDGERYLAGALEGLPHVYDVDGYGYSPRGMGLRPLVVIDPADVDVDAITLHVRDDEQPGDAHPDDFELTRQDVLRVLESLGIETP